MPKDTDRIRGTFREIDQAARYLRDNLTPAEAKLWSALRRRQLSGFKFRCQHPVGMFIVDFYCPSCRLVVEVDGSIHDQQEDYDKTRTRRLQSFGYRVLRFDNNEVLSNLEEVLARIKQAAECS